MKKCMISLLATAVVIFSATQSDAGPHEPASQGPPASAVSVPAPSAPAVTGAPAAVIKDTKYEFEPVVEGKEVVHEFTVENTGTAPLQLERIQTGCGCTTADFTRTIPPGGRGSITIKAHTNGRGGSVFKRNITVFTNDPKNKTMELVFTGKVDKFVNINPATAILKGKADESIEILVSVRPDAKHPFKVVDSSMEKTLEGKIEFGLEKFETGYVVLRIRNKLQAAGQYYGRILLKTDNPDNPEIAIPVSGRIG